MMKLFKILKNMARFLLPTGGESLTPLIKSNDLDGNTEWSDISYISEGDYIELAETLATAFSSDRAYNKGNFCSYKASFEEEAVTYEANQEIPANQSGFIISQWDPVSEDWSEELVHEPYSNFFYRSSDSSSSKTYTTNGITWTLNEDGSITATGVASARASFTVVGNVYVPAIDVGEDTWFRFYGCPSGGSSATFYNKITFVDSNNNYSSAWDYGEGNYSDIKAQYATITLYIESGVDCTVQGLTFKPSLRCYIRGTNIPRNVNSEDSSLLIRTGSLSSSSSGGGYNAFFGTCSTAANTAEKAVTCTGYSLAAENIIGILFTTANTSSTPTLNINNTAAKSIYIGNSIPNSTTNVLKWSANTVVYFMWDGEQYRYITNTSASDIQQSRGASTWVGTCSSTEESTAKAVEIDNYVLTIGSLSTITFTHSVPALSTLNINETGIKDIYYQGDNIGNDIIQEGDTATFIYDGTHYILAAIDNKPITNEEIDEMFGAASGTGTNAQDYVIEHGTSGIWTYRKWASGIAECWGTTTFTGTTNQSWGSNIKYTTVPSVNYPFTFVAITGKTTIFDSGGAWSTGCYDQTNSATGDFYVCRPDSNSVSGRVYYNIKGLWK